MFQKFRTAKLAAAATITLMVGGTAAAAATGSLPDARPVPSSSRARFVARGRGAGRSRPTSHDSAKHHGAPRCSARSRRSTACRIPARAASPTPTARSRSNASQGQDLDGQRRPPTPSSRSSTRDDDAVVRERVRRLAREGEGHARGHHARRGERCGSRTRVSHAVKHEARAQGCLRSGRVGERRERPGDLRHADTAGTFTVNGFKGDTFTVNVDPATAFAAKDVTDAVVRQRVRRPAGVRQGRRDRLDRRRDRSVHRPAEVRRPR